MLEAEIKKGIRDRNRTYVLISIIFALLSYFWWEFDYNSPQSQQARSNSAAEIKSQQVQAEHQRILSDPRVLKMQAEEMLKARLNVKITKWTNDDRYEYIEGEVQNNSEQDLRYWEISLEFTNKKGEVIHTAMENSGTNLAPKAKERFKTTIDRVSSAESVNSRVAEVYAQ